MKNCRYVSVILILSILFSNLIPVSQLLAQSPMAFGEMKIAGDVMIKSSTGQWVKVQGNYPLLAKTELRTKDGIVSITTRDGSKIDILKETEAIISVTESIYNIELLGCDKGALTFNMAPPALLTVDTKQVDISTVRAPSQANRLGSLNNNDKGTEIKSIAGTIIANLWSKEQRTLNSGESLSVSMSDVCLAILAAGTGAGTAATPGTSVLLRGLIIGGVLIGGGVVAYEAFREEGVASPSGFTSR